MKVKELIKDLSKLNQEAYCVVYVDPSNQEEETRKFEVIGVYTEKENVEEVELFLLIAD